MWICCQIGAREHYAVPRALHRKGRLAGLYTDFWAGGALKALGKMGFMRSLAGRYHPELDRYHGANGRGLRVAHGKRGTLVHSWNSRAIWWEIGRGRNRARRQDGNSTQAAAAGNESVASGLSVSRRYQGYVEAGRHFASNIRAALAKQQNSLPEKIVFAYDTGALELFEWCREHAVKCLLNQMDPNRVEVEMVQAEEKRWPGWTLHPTLIPEEYLRRREQEWNLSDRIVVNSEFCRQALLTQGVAPEKLVVIPLCYEIEKKRPNAENVGPKLTNGPSSLLSRRSCRELRVLFIGQVVLRKGIQYLIDAARMLEQENIQFDIVGPIGISQDAVASAPRNVIFHGRAFRNQAANWYCNADIFVLPTVSDGFAITQLEAMAHGLPVVATPSCGDVVSDGKDGFIVPPRDSTALARVFQRFIAEPELLRSQSIAALAKAKQFTLNRLASDLVKLEAALV